MNDKTGGEKQEEKGSDYFSCTCQISNFKILAQAVLEFPSCQKKLWMDGQTVRWMDGQN